MKKLTLVVAAAMLFLGWKVYAGEGITAPNSNGSNPINADYGGVDIGTSAFSSNVSTVPSAISGNGISYADFYKSTWTGTGGYYGNIGNTRQNTRIYGVDFSTGLCGAMDNVAIFVSSGGWTPSSLEITRVYNIYNSTAQAAATGTNAACGGITPLRWPIRVYGNVFWKPSVATYNHANLLYWVEPQ